VAAMKAKVDRRGRKRASMNQIPHRHFTVAGSQFARSLWFTLGLMTIAIAGGSADAAETRTPYQTYVNLNCPGGLNCILDFQAVPPNYRYEIDNVSCYLRGKDKYFDMDFVQLIVVRADNSNAAATTLPVTKVGTDNSFVRGLAINEKVAAFATAQQHFQIYERMRFSGVVNSIECHLSGEKVKLS